MKKLILFFYSVLLSATLSAQSSAPLYMNPAMSQFTPFQLIDSVLVTGCMDVANVTYVGSYTAAGYFQRVVNNFPFVRGVVLTSGNFANAKGPNTSPSSSGSNGTGSDPQLASLTSYSIYDKNVIEFDFVPHGNFVEFRYIFGSEEYPEFAPPSSSSFNDVFGFFISGPSTGCPNLPAAQSPNYMNYNIARVPGSGLPVSINNINAITNNTYYVNNNFQTPPANQTAIGYDGYTVPLTASACVVPCETYHIKLAIGDAGDSAYDSGVFLEGGSLNSGSSVVMNAYDQSGESTNELYEGCTGFVIFNRTDTSDLNLPFNVSLNITGTASTAADLSGFPSNFQIPGGQMSDTIFYTAIMDNVNEGVETVILQLLSGCPCTPTLLSDTIFLFDNVEMIGGIVQNDTVICAPANVNSVNVTLNATANTPTAITTYQWNNGSASPTITVNVPTGTIVTYTVTISDGCGQVIVDEIVLTVSDLNTYDLDINNLLCNGICQGSVNIVPLDGFAPYTFSWTPGGIGMITTGSANNLCSGNYSVTITDAYGCIKATPFTITQPPVTTLSFTSVSSSCPGAADGLINATVNYGPGTPYAIVPPYTWSISGYMPVSDNDNVYSFQNLPAGNFTVNVIDGNGCTTSGIHTVGENEMLFTPQITNVKCYGGSDGAATFTLTGGSAPYSFLWNSGETSQNISGKSAGNYSCTVTDVNGCELIVPLTINQPARLEFSNSLDTIMCKGEQTILTASAQGGTAPYNYVWSANGNQIGTGAALAYSPTVTTTVTLTVSDNNGCVQPSHTVVVQIHPKVSVNLFTNQSVICAGESTTIYVEVSGGNGGPYTITNNNGDILIPPIVVNPQTSTTYTFYANDDCGSPQGVDNQQVQVETPPSVNFYATDTIGCAPFTTTFIETSANNGQSYLWQFGIDNNAISLTKNPTFTFGTFGSYDISLTVTSPNGCSRTKEISNMITVLPAPVLGIMPDPPVSSSLNPVIHFMNSTDSPMDTTTIFFGDGNSLLLNTLLFPEVQYTYADTGVFHVYLVGYNTLGCVDTAYTEVEIYAEHKHIVAPNVINPTSNIAENQIFLPTGFAINKSEFHLIIYNRWGNIVFESNHGDFGWNGRMPNGELAKSDTYQWVLIYKDNIGKTLRESGNVTVIY